MNCWNADLTNPSPLPLYVSEGSNLNTLLVAYRGSYANGAGGMEQIGIAQASNDSYAANYNLGGGPIVPYSNEDPFLRQDPRGYFHMLMHCTDGRIGGGIGQPAVGHHAYAECWNCPWTYNSNIFAYKTTVQFADRSSTTYYRRERPQLFFDPDGTPAFLVNGVQEFNVASSHTLITPIGPLY
jgi:hypothetical protein